MAGGSRLLGFGGGLFLLWSAARTIRRRQLLASQPQTVPPSSFTAYTSAVALGASNPMGPLLMVALLTPIVGSSTPGLGSAALLLLGTFIAATTWWVCLSGGITLLRSRLSPRALWIVNQAAGAAMTAYGLAALIRSAGM